MTEQLLLWWRGRTRREQGLLLVMLALATVLIGWLLVVRPLSDRIDEAQRRHGAALVALAEKRGEAEALRRLESRPTVEATLPIDAMINRSAAEAGFTGARTVGQGPARATVAIDAARPQAFFAWVAELERSGLAVDRLRAQANSDRTLSAELVLRARSR